MKMMKKLSAALVACLMVIGASLPAKALSFDEAYWLQVALEDHGFDVGEPDGRIGPQTRSAMAEFGEKYDLPSEPDALIQAIINRNASHSYKITNEANLTDELLNAITDSVAVQLRDPDSVQVRNVRIVEDSNGKFFCGEVNGKNAYGGYAGFISFRTLDISRVLGLQSIIDTSDRNFAFLTCNLAIPKID